MGKTLWMRSLQQADATRQFDVAGKFTVPLSMLLNKMIMKGFTGMLERLGC